MHISDQKREAVINGERRRRALKVLVTAGVSAIYSARCDRRGQS